MKKCQEHGINSDCEYHGRNCNHTWIGTNASVTPQELFEMATYRLHEILSSGEVRTVSEINGSYIHPFNATHLENIRVSELRKRSHGRCYTIGLESPLRRVPVYYIKFEL